MSRNFGLGRHAPLAHRAGGARRRHAFDASQSIIFAIIAVQGGQRTIENGKEEEEDR
jgi:hypothetical protein